MRTHKRLIALVLVVVMALSGTLMSVVSAAKLADADNYPTKGALTGVTLAYAIDILQQLGVVAGVSNVKDDDGKVVEYTFDGDALVTRQQFALFTARIATALPNLFVVDPTADVKSESKFTDLVDKVYTPAIDHCFGEGYVIGVNDENTLFNPLGKITFAEAVTMLTRALGYTGLVYPTGFMTKASAWDVALIGEYADFPMDDIAQNTPITRAQMAMLLWNFLLSQRWELEMVYNGEKGQWDAERKPHAILDTFGIKRTVGYVTAVPGWTAKLDVVDYSYSYYDKDDKLVVVNVGPRQGGGLLSANTQFQVYRDICVSPRNGAERIITTMDKLGLSEYKDDPLELLGLKVTVYEDKRVNPEFNINIPAIVYGTKTEIDIEEVDGAFNTGDSGIVDKLSIPFPAIEDLVMDKADFLAAPVANLYTFDGDALMSGVKAVDRGAAGVAAFENTKYLAQKAANKTNYRLELVYNGLYSDGTPEYFYIFRPFKVGVYVKDNDGAIRADKPMVFTTEVVKVAAGNPIVAHAANFMDEDIDELVANKAYLYTYYGANLDIYAELTEDVKAIPIAANMNAKLVTFKLSAGNKNVYFNSDRPKADGAWANANNINPNGKGEYTIYYDGAAALLARRTNDGPDEYQKSQYVVILKLSTTREVTLRDPETQARIGQGFRATVLNAQTGKTEEMVINMVDEVVDDFKFGKISLLNAAGTLDVSQAYGTPVRLVSKGFDFYDVATVENKNFITHVLDKEYAGAKDPVASPAAAGDVSGNRVDLKVKWAGSTTVLNDPVRAFINANTNIVIYSVAENKAVRYTGNAAGLDYLKEVIGTAAKPGNATDLIVVGLGNSGTGVASTVFLKTSDKIKGPAISTDNYAIVLNADAGLTSGGYYYGTARLADGKDVNVASRVPGVIARGNLVALTGDKVTAFDVEYTLANSADDKLNLVGSDATPIPAKFTDFFATVTNLPKKTNDEQLWAKGDRVGLSDYYEGFGFDLNKMKFGDPASNFFKFDKNSFKVVVAYTIPAVAAVPAKDTTPAVAAVPAKDVLVTEGRPTLADANVKQQFINITYTEYKRIIDAGGKVFIFAYTAGDTSVGGTGEKDEAVVFATMLIDLRGVDKDSAKKAGWVNADAATNPTWCTPFGWRNDY